MPVLRSDLKLTSITVDKRGYSRQYFQHHHKHANTLCRPRTGANLLAKKVGGKVLVAPRTFAHLLLFNQLGIGLPFRLSTYTPHTNCESPALQVQLFAGDISDSHHSSFSPR